MPLVDGLTLHRPESIVLGLITFACCTAGLLLSHVVSLASVATYGKLAAKDRWNWNIGSVRGAAGLALFLMAIAAYVDPQLYAGHPVWGRSQLSVTALPCIVAFFTFEMVTFALMTAVYQYKNNALLVHHVFCLWYWGYAIAYTDSFHFLATKGLIQEVTAAFSDLTWKMVKCNNTHSRSYFGTQYLLVFLWVFVRIADDAHRVWFVYTNWAVLAAEGPGVAFWGTVVTTVLLALLLNPHWLHMKVKQLQRQLRKVQKTQ